MKEELAWDGGRIVAILDGKDWRMGFAPNYDPDWARTALAELRSRGVVTVSPTEELPHIDENDVVWATLTTAGWDMWEEEG